MLDFCLPCGQVQSIEDIITNVADSAHEGKFEFALGEQKCAAE